MQTVSNLRADCLSLLHTLPHPQLNLVPQSSQLRDRGGDTSVNKREHIRNIKATEGLAQ